jgi:alkanesulfonate monooxygenase SsuD/methylene tetrahydromethanopterin reductase-like flavin-dependent oxidoreductase (luciferase family)
MQLGLMTEPQTGGTYDQLLELARWAEARGLDSFARSDHYLAGSTSAHATDALTTLAGLARDTERIQLAVMVTPLTFRHPAVIAKTAATIDEMSDGRFALGIGTGWMETEHDTFGIELHDLPERFDRLAETLGYVRAAFAGSQGFQGERYGLQPVDVLPRPTGELPIIIGGGGMRLTPTLAGRFADEYNMFACETETFERRTAVMREAAGATGRDPEEIAVSFAAPTVVAATEDGFRHLVADRAARREVTPDEYLKLLRARNIPHGTPEQAAGILRQIAEMGVTKTYLHEPKPLGDIDTATLGAVVAAAIAT